MKIATPLRKLALVAAALAGSMAFGQVTTDYTKTGIPNGTPSAIAATTGTGSTMVLQSSPTINTPTFIAPVLGTPGSGTLTNATGLPISTGVSGLAAGVSTFLGTATSANLSAAVSDETGSGALVFASSPTLNTPTLSIPKISTSTWANLPAAASNGWAMSVASDLGANGTLVSSNGTRWRPVNGESNLRQLGATTGNIANSETIVLQTQLPAGAWQAGDTVRIWITGTKSGTTDSANLTVRIGTAGTTSDTAINSLSAYGIGNAGAVSIGGIYDIKLLSNTSAQKVGGNSGASNSYPGSSGTAAATATTITDASANALYVTISMASSGASNTVTVTSAQIQLITP